MPNMTEKEAMDIVWHMANMWLSESTQRFQPDPVYNEWTDYIGDFLEGHDPNNTESAAEEALRVMHKTMYVPPNNECQVV